MKPTKTPTTPTTMEVNLLEQVAKITNGDRRRDYGRPLINHVRIAVKWSARITQRIVRGLPPVTPSVVVELMLDLKDARQVNTPKFDNILDTVGYMVCLDDMARELVERGDAEDYENALRQLDRMTETVMKLLLLDLERAELQMRITEKYRNKE